MCAFVSQRSNVSTYLLLHKFYKQSVSSTSISRVVLPCRYLHNRNKMPAAGDDHVEEAVAVEKSPDDIEYLDGEAENSLQIFDEIKLSIFTYEWKIRKINEPLPAAATSTLPILWSPSVLTRNDDFSFQWKIFYQFMNSPLGDSLIISLEQFDNSGDSIEVRVRSHVTYLFNDHDVHSEYFYQKLDLSVPLDERQYPRQLNVMGFHEARSITVDLEFEIAEQLY